MIKKIRRILRKIVAIFSYKKYLVLGDSHAIVFDSPLFYLFFPLVYFDVVSVQGATISGIENPNSKTDAYNTFQLELIKRKNIRKIILLLGEVDVGFLVWYKAEKKKLNVLEILNDTIDKYIRFIQECKYYAPVIVISAPLPTINDNDSNWGEVANMRKEVKATKKQRTLLTLEFNNLVKKYCKQVGIEYLDLDKASLGEDGYVSKYLLNANKNDHHYSRRKYAYLLKKHIKTYI